MDLKDIKAIVDLMKKNSISEFEMEKEEFKIKLKRGLGNTGSTSEEGPYLISPSVSHALPPLQPTAQVATPKVQTENPEPKTSNDLDICSPMIGTFYDSPSPDSPAYVEVGTRVNAETVVCIVEAMKVMNEIKAEKSGVITELLVENARPVEFGQALFKVKPN
ncbi:MAG: acetyl-CoA carboxylase biotin carboxyl carrier protein [Verrucomicrobiae bacterium]|nr:acetyl-CoA carboxylase, biotin carboxyl carrier protein [Pedosphaera sp.]MBL6842511.1 acetyl-CoA carboxylase biotin carboxyl carrier protein [Verrucomicrobiae bacterium]RZO68286.1 MAG: acetyl-CoA carboxylase biotin carboxyl carrier protein [Limisphaerales bacterium]HAR00241.1 acetyl-CoA carboxylase biotin carboxyl carrier protein [Verrucomicrobiales bacterium]HBP54549.1 acetyl-CoA carboxylase biotin carboxyl carrier protein [Verrucomicrobiales bacterium]